MLALLIATQAAVTFVVRRSVIPDDAYIYSRVARQVLAGHGWTFNAGERLDACTGPLFEALLVPAVWALRNVELGFALLFVAGVVASGLLFFRLLQPQTGWLLAALGMIGFLRCPVVPFSIGLETTLFLALTLASLLAYTQRRWELTGLLLALTCLARGDGMILAGVVVAHYFWTERRLPGWRACAIFAAPVVGWMLFHWVWFGVPFPTGEEAKIAQGTSGLWSGFFAGAHKFFFDAYRPAGRIGNVALLVAGTAGWIVSWLRRRTAGMILGAFALLHAIAYSFLKVAAYPWYYGLAFLACWYLTTELCGWVRLVRPSPALPMPLGSAAAWAAGAVLLVLVLALGNFRSFFVAGASSTQSYALLVDQIRPRMHPGDSLLSPEIGLLGDRLIEQRILDTVGLTSFLSPEEIASRRFTAWLEPGHERPDWVLLLRRYRLLLTGIPGDLARAVPQEYETAAAMRGAEYGYSGVLLHRRSQADRDASLVALFEHTAPVKSAVSVRADYLGDLPTTLVYQPPPSRLTMRIRIGERSWLRFGYGIERAARGRPSGVRFKIEAQGQGESQARGIFTVDVRPRDHKGERKWQEAKLDLRAWSGRDLDLTFVTEPLRTPSFFTGAWVDPRLVDDTAGPLFPASALP